MENKQQLNKTLLEGWSIILLGLGIIYLIGLMKKQISICYLLMFLAVTLIPYVMIYITYKYNKDIKNFEYLIIIGYCLMYGFVIFTQTSYLGFAYILPLLSILIICHNPQLILTTGIISIIINFLGIILNNNNNNNNYYELELIVLFLSIIGSYMSTKMYEKYINENVQNIKTIEKQIKKINKISLQTVCTIANTIDARDEYTKGHSSRVADYSALLAHKLGLSKEEVKEVYSIALLHDIGKIGIPDSILNKPGKLTNEEFQIMKNHTVIGGNILKDMSILKNIDLGAKYHHERYDGKGYPDGLKGEDIPFIARIISVADAFDAMTSDRVYRKHLDSVVVRAEIEKGIGTQFDPKVAKAMLELIDTEEVRKEYIDLICSSEY